MFIKAWSLPPVGPCHVFICPGYQDCSLFAIFFCLILKKDSLSIKYCLYIILTYLGIVWRQKTSSCLRLWLYLYIIEIACTCKYLKNKIGLLLENNELSKDVWFLNYMLLSSSPKPPPSSIGSYLYSLLQLHNLQDLSCERLLSQKLRSEKAEDLRALESVRGELSCAQRNVSEALARQEELQRELRRQTERLEDKERHINNIRCEECWYVLE